MTTKYRCHSRCHTANSNVAPRCHPGHCIDVASQGEPLTCHVTRFGGGGMVGEPQVSRGGSSGHCGWCQRLAVVVKVGGGDECGGKKRDGHVWH